MKKFLSLLLVAMMLLSCLPALAEENPEWRINNSTGLVKRNSSYDEADHIVVPDQVNGVAVRGLEYMALSSCREALQITIPDSIRYFDNGTLSRMYNLTELTLPADLLIIRAGSLDEIPNLQQLVIPPSVSLIQGAINSCPQLTSITFQGVCPVFCFEKTYGTFSDLPDSCVIYVPDDQLDAYKAAFADREDVLARIQPSGQNAVVVDWTAPESDFVFDASTGTITGYKGSASRLEIPASIGGVAVRHIAAKAFQKDYSLMYVTIPEGVETLGDYAFQGNTLMTYVSLPTTLRTIGNSAFASNSLVDVRWSEGLEAIGSKAFYNCDLYYVTLPTTLRTIADNGFERAGMTTLTFGPNVETIGEVAFTGNSLTAITYTGTTMPVIAANAFKDIKKDATLTLADGCPQELYDSFVTYMATAFPTCVVNEPAGMAQPFPTLDVMAGMPFFGTWHGVAASDGVDVYGLELLGMSVDVTMNPDATCAMVMDGETISGAWYVENGAAMFAPVLEEGGEPMQEEALPLALDENGRMSIDLGGIWLLLELEGKVYETPAIPEKPWPELDADKAQYYVGTWDAVSYIVDGDTYPAELVGPTTLILNADGTAQMTEGEEEAYELRWYAESYSAYVGPAMSALVEIYFDANGNLEMMQDGSKIVFAPHVDVKVIEGADELLGDWYDDVDNKLTLVNDGTLTHTYSFDGWVDTYAWDVVDGAAVVTEGPWSGLPIVLENGILIITNDEGIFQIFSRDGDLSAYYGEDDEDMPEAQPIGDEGAAYFGTWKADMYGIEVTLTMNPDGTCAIEMFGEADLGVWSVVDGKASIMGDELYIDGDGNLVYASQGMVFTKAGGAAPEAPAVPEAPAADLPETLQPFVGTWHLCYVATGGLEGDLRSMGLTGKMVLNADGTGAMTGLSDESGIWYDDEGQVRFGDSGMPLFLLDGGFLRYGTELSGYMVFSQNESATWSPAPAATPVPAPAAPTAAPAAPAAPTGGNVERLNVKFVCKSYTSAGFTLDASMLGAEYALLFREGGTCDFTMAGFTAANLPYTVSAEGVYVINYYGTMFNCTPTDAGFDMDFYGTMMMHFVPAE